MIDNCCSTVGYAEKGIRRKTGADHKPHGTVEPTLEEIIAGRNTPRALRFMVEFLTPKVSGAKGWEAEICTSLVQITNFTTSDEMMTKLALENMWCQWHAEPGSLLRDKGKRNVYKTRFQSEGYGVVTGGH
jgi:hypothetical protein